MKPPPKTKPGKRIAVTLYATRQTKALARERANEAGTSIGRWLDDAVARRYRPPND